MRLRRWISFGVITVLVLAALGCAGWFYFVNFSPDRGHYPVRGLDVSHHQGQINWAQVAADDVSFVYLKATEGGDHVDREIAANLAGAQAAGVAVGLYHFFTLCRPGAEQAANFLAQVPLEVPMLPPVVDLEYGGNCSARPAPEDLARELNAFLAPVEAAFGRPAVYYLLDDFERDYGAVLPKRSLWVRSLAMEPWSKDWLFWQYHDRGRVAGIEGDVDLNVFDDGAAALAELVRAPSEMTSSPPAGSQ